jgi:uncharacterized protein (TIGR02646 family)
MHLLDRKACPPPPCLSKFNPEEHDWDDVKGNDKAEIRKALVRMQGERCAYCEGPLFAGHGHIEHFRRKNKEHFPELTFVWENLFLSCDSRTNCGHFKDRPSGPAYRSDDLVKPDEDDPESFFYFSVTGEVRVQAEADAASCAQANETIRVLGLNHPALVAQRRKAVARYKRGRGSTFDIAGLSDEHRWLFLQREIEETKDIPFCTTVHHFLRRQG